jgi:hypothetical protein
MTAYLRDPPVAERRNMGAQLLLTHEILWITKA